MAGRAEISENTNLFVCATESLLSVYNFVVLCRHLCLLEFTLGAVDPGEHGFTGDDMLEKPLLLFHTLALSSNGKVLGIQHILFQSFGLLFSLSNALGLTSNLLSSLEFLLLLKSMCCLLLLPFSCATCKVFIHYLNFGLSTEEETSTVRSIHLLL